jgi:subtilisin family serine protease
MKPFTLARLLLLTGTLTIVACQQPTDAPLNLHARSAHLTRSGTHVGYVPSATPSPRRSPNFTGLSDAQLANAVSDAKGQVFIGIKEAGATDGVDPFGRSLVSAATLAGVKETLQTLGVKFNYEFKTLPAVVATVPPTLVASLRALQNVDYVEPVVTSGGFSAQDTTWNVTQVQAPTAWSYASGTGVILLIMDTGVELTHPDLYVPVAWHCVNGTLPDTDYFGHGTHVAGIAAALNNTVGVIGVAPNVHLWSANILNSTPQIDAGEAACSIDVGNVNGVFAYNMSWYLTAQNTTLNDAIHSAYYTYGSFFAAAAGNSPNDSVTSPANLTEVVAVTAVDSLNAHASFAVTGSKVELSAPGVDVYSTALPSGSPSYCGGNGSYYALCSGTSMASPHVAAAAALLKSYNSSWSNVKIRAMLDSSATNLGTASTFGWGLLQVYSAIVW